MRLRSLSLRNFRCFGPSAEVVHLDDFTALVGTNSSGKSAVMQALCKLFAANPKQRDLERSDFHLPLDGGALANGTTLELEAKFEFPELLPPPPGVDPDPAAQGVPHFFRHIAVRRAGEIPSVRLRLRGTWYEGTTPEGEIEEVLEVITAPQSGTAAGVRTSTPISRRERSHVEFLYVPAARDPSSQLRRQAHSFLWRIMNAIRWSSDVKQQVRSSAETLNELIAQTPGFAAAKEILGRNWTQFHDDLRFAHLSIEASPENLDDLLDRVEVSFRASPVSRPAPPEQIGDGLRSLFYLSLVSSLLDVQRQMVGSASSPSAAFDPQSVHVPALTLLGVEEPENHLAPHVLGNAVATLLKTSQLANGQVIITTHTPSLLRRVEPRSVRHLRQESPGGTRVRELRLPQGTQEEYKYVKEAVRAYPELYFARAVVLGEGDSEEVVLPRVLEALSSPIDPLKVSVVPLGGRHVNHFWRLLRNLQIPFVTLLDYDEGRTGGGVGRLQYVLKQLVALEAEHPSSERVLLDLSEQRVTPEAALDMLAGHTTSPGDLPKQLVSALQEYGIFFSFPLDLDLLMYRTFKDDYQTSGGPELAEFLHQQRQHAAKWKKQGESALNAIFKEGNPTIPSAEIEDYIWYRHLFLKRGKPATHLMALHDLPPETLRSAAPAPFGAMVELLQRMLTGTAG